MNRLVALDLPPGPDFVEALQRVWDAGDAALPIDQRLPPAARAELLAGLGVGLPVEPGDALVLATSGTTGRPKGVVLTHEALAAHAAAANAFLGVDPQRDAWLSCLPLAHIGGLGVVVRALLSDTPLIVHERFDAHAVIQASHSASLTSLVPTALNRIDPAAFRAILLGGSGDPTPRPPHVVHTYGMTESGGGVVYEGRALPGVEVRVVDDEIQLRSATLLRAYRDGHDPRTVDGWYPTGDGGALRPDGTLDVFGRIGDMIMTGGENVWPQAVEAALEGAPGVAEVMVVGRHDPEWGQRVVAIVVPQQSGPPPTIESLREHAKARIASYAAPRAIEIVTALDRTALGKLRRPAVVREP